MLPARPLTSTALSRRLWAGRLALFMALFGALAPTASRALALARGEAPSLIEVCTSQGPRWMALSQAVDLPSDAPNQPDATTVLAHCPFCLLALDRLAPPPAPYTPVFLPGPSASSLVPAAIFFAVTHIDPAPPPRGPPLSC